jgi:hypothetical protein
MPSFEANFKKLCNWIRNSHIFEPELTSEVIQCIEDHGIEYDFRVSYENKGDLFGRSPPETKYLTCRMYIEDANQAMLFKLRWL